MEYPTKAFLTAGVLIAAMSCATDPVAPGIDTIQPSFAISSTGAQIVTEAEIARQAENTPPTKSWVLYTRAGGTGTFRVGPGTAPEGVGSMEFSTPLSVDKVYLYNFDYVGTALSDLSELRYASYRTVGVGVAVVSLNIQVDKTGGSFNTGDFTTLVFEPYINPAQGPVLNDVWQTWDAYNSGLGMWWSTGGLPGCMQSTPCTWSTILALIPNATVLGGLGMNQGSGNPGITSAFDQLIVRFGSAAAITYDFELFVTATTRETCKGGGWEVAKRADGSSFKNQGDCVSYVQNGE